MKSFKTFLLVSVLFLAACGTDETPVDTCIQGFDQQAMFQNIADNLITPSYALLKQNVDQMQVKSEAFFLNPNQTTLVSLQNAHTESYLSWQTLAPYEFGPAETVFLRNSINNFPVNTAAVEANILSGNIDFDQPDKYDKGFPAIDYLIFGIGTNTTEILSRYTTDANADALKIHLRALLDDLIARVTKTKDAWENTYKASFITNTGTAAGTSLSLLVNGINENYELIKREKVGFPSGVLTSGFSNPEAVESVYSGKSFFLLRSALTTTRNLYLGNRTELGLGLDDYLQQVNAEKDGQKLDDLIQTQFTAIFDALDAIDQPLEQAIADDPAKVETLYREIALQVPHLKTSLASVLCVAITYIDNPSDSD